VISEQLPAAWRGPLVLGAFGCQAVGALSGSLLGWLLAAGDSLGPLGWRSLYLLPVLPVLLLTGARLGVPESPGWRPPGVTQLPAAPEGGSAAGAGQMQTAPAAPSPLTPQAASPQTTPALRPLLLAGLPWFAQDLSTYGVGIFLPQLLVEGGVQRHSLGWATAADGLFVAGIGLAIVLVDRLGRIRLQVAGFAGCAAGLALAAWGCSGAVQAPSLVIAGVGLFLFMTNAGPNATTYLLAGEVFPIAQRGQGAGLAAAAGKAGAVLAALTLPGLLHRWGSGAVLAGLAISSVIGALLTGWLRVGPALEPAEFGTGTASAQER
jgi:MFS family permease